MAQSIKNRVFGDDIPVKIKKKIEARQLLSKKDRNPNEEIRPSQYPDSRPNYYTFGELDKHNNFGNIADLSSRTPFARMWTALNVSTDVHITNTSYGSTLNKEDAAKWEGEKENAKPDSPDFKNRYLKSVTNEEYEIHEWKDLDESLKIYTLGNHILGTEQIGPNTPRTQAAGDVSSNIMKELLPFEQETDMNAFLKPPAGITSISSETDGALGIIKKTTVNFIVQNFSDFEKIYLKYFMKPGAQVFVDFGWDTGLLYDPENLLQDVDKLESNLYGSTGYVTKSDGDMETIYGHVVNYDAKIREDGGFDCSVEIISKNAALLSNSFDPKLKERVKYGLDIEIMGFAISDLMGDYNIYKAASQWGQAESTSEELKHVFTVSTIKYLGGTTAPLPGMLDTKSSMNALKYGVFYAGTMEENTKLFVNFGWFEDNFLNKELAFSDDSNSLLNKDKDVAGADEDKLFAKFNSRNSFITYNEDLKKAMKMRGFYEGAVFLYPDTWGSYGPTYNSQIKMVPDDRYGAESPYWKWRNGASVEEIDVSVDRSSAGEYKLPGAPDNDISSTDTYSIENCDKNESKIPLREIFISVDMIKTSIDKSSNTSDFLKDIMTRMKEASGGIVDMSMQSNNYGQHVISFIDKNLLSKTTKTPTDGTELPEFLEDLLMFNPYSPDTIVKEYDLQFSMPQGGLGNMIAIQSADSLGNDQSINDLLDGLIKLEEMDRKAIVDKFVRYFPSVGREAGRRLVKTTSRESAGTFNFKQEDVAFGSKKGGAPKDINMDTNLGDGVPFNDYQDQLYTNLDRALDENQNLEGEDTTPEPTEEKTPEDTKKAEEDIAKSSNENLVNTPYDFWIKQAVKKHTSTVSPLIPIQISLKIYGISGLMPGNLIRVNYLPEKYWKNAYFQIHKVSQNVGDTWDTSLETQMRVAPIKRKGTEKKVVVRKSYLRNVLKLEKIDTFIHAFGNLIPLDIPKSPSGERLVYLDNIFMCTAVGSIEDGSDFDLPILWSPKESSELTNIMGGSFFGSWQAGTDGVSVKFDVNKEWTAFLQDVVIDDVDYSGVEIKVKKIEKDAKFFIITSGDKWIIWNSTDASKLETINKMFSLTRGKEISKELKEKSWKATGQQITKKVGQAKDAVVDFMGDAADVVEDFVTEPVQTLKKVGEKVKNLFSGWW